MGEITIDKFKELFKDYKIHHDNYDCSEIAEDLFMLAGGLEGDILRLKSKDDITDIIIIEYDREINVRYHDILVLKGMVYDPRYNKNKREPIPLGKYVGKIGEINIAEVLVTLVK